MSTQRSLRDGLRRLADEAPRAAVPGDFFELARARSRQRRTVRAAAAVVALLTVTLGLALRPGGAPEPGAPAATAGLPTRLRVPPIWTALVDQSPPGTAAAIFGGHATTDDWNEGRFAVVAAAGDRYRVFNEFEYTAPGFGALLSPDGDLVARNRTVRSLRPDRQLSIVLPGDPRAFSPDGTLVVYETGDYTVNIDGVEHRDSRIGVYDLRRREEIVSVDNSDNLLPVAVALSPDNARLAVQVHDEIHLYRLDGPRPAPYATVRLESETLAGPGAWLPGGRSFATSRRSADGTWHLVRHDGETGEAGPAGGLPSVADARYVRVIGWRPDGTALAVVAVPAPGAPPARLFGEHPWVPYQDSQTVRSRLVALTPGAAAPTVLLETPDGVGDLDVAADLAVAGQLRAPGDPDYGPPAPFVQAIGVVLLLVLAVPLLLLLARLRRPRRGAARPDPAGAV